MVQVPVIETERLKLRGHLSEEESWEKRWEEIQNKMWA
jgi:hypothetical protein